MSTRFRVPAGMETVRQRLADYFARIDFTPAPGVKGVVMQRGALLRSALRWEPRTLPVRVDAQLHPMDEQTEVVLTLELNRTGHVIVGAELEVLQRELLEAVRFVVEGEANFARLEQLNQRVRERANLAIWLGIAVAIPIFVALFVFVRPLLVEWGVTRATRIVIMSGLSGMVFGATAWLFVKFMMRSAGE
ncbi:MAG: hypothetical protein N2651_04620 [Fimbriimonadales bacterium]|nr:hypothetical protein [Fimbriimonadales bacterium]